MISCLKRLFCHLILNIWFLIPPLVYGAPAEVWVSSHYDDTTPGWGSTHFSKIGDGINEVAEGGTAHVMPGTYFENLVIQKSLSLLGESVDTTRIDGRGFGHTVSIRRATDVILSGFILANAGEWNNWAVILDGGASKVAVTNNRILDKGIGLINSHNNNITDNYLEGQGSIFLSGARGNHIVGNEMYVSYPGQIWTLGNSSNNVISDNTITGVPGNTSCTGIRSRQSSNNLYLNNTVRNFRVNVLLTCSNNSIIANNNISGYRERSADGGGLVMYRASNNTIINNNISSVIDGGITLFGSSSNNTLLGNTIRDAERGIELYYQSNDNLVVNNDVSTNHMGIILDDTSGNIVYRNSFINNQKQGYDDSDNSWDHNGEGNYWSDYEGKDDNGDGIGDTEHIIFPEGTDHYPFISSVEMVTVEVPELEPAPVEEQAGSMIFIDDQRVWKNQTIELTESVHIQDGGSLTIENVTLLANHDDHYVIFEVYSGGTLRIYDSKIISQGACIRSSEGSELHIENSELYGLGVWGGAIVINCDRAVIENNIIDGGYTGIKTSGGSSQHRIIGNKISNFRSGIQFCCETSSDNLIENNEISNVIGEAIAASGLISSTITGNTFQDVWRETFDLRHAGVERTNGNLIYGNHFVNCDSLGYDEGDNQWYGNFWNGEEFSGFSPPTYDPGEIDPDPARVTISGSVSLADGTPLCAMVLANGQYMFTCAENNGMYDLEVPLDANGEITLYGFCNGQAPFKAILAPDQASSFDIIMEPASQDSSVINVTAEMEASVLNLGWVSISGKVTTERGTSLRNVSMKMRHLLI